MLQRDHVDGLVGHLFRHQAGAMVSTLTRILGSRNLDLAEDVVQDALVKAIECWPYAGIPDRPALWLVAAAKNRAIDLLRRQVTSRAKMDQILAELRPVEDVAGAEAAALSRGVVDDVLGMLFMCCHLSIPREARVALALRAVAGLSVAEIARAFLAQESTIAQRIVRAKRHIREQDVVVEVPHSGELVGRLDSVLEVLYLWFNEGYGAHEGTELVRTDLCDEAIRLARLLANHPATDRPTCHALLALMLLQAARFPTRIDGEGNLLLLRDQDRPQWDQRLVDLGLRHLERCAEGQEVGAYHLEAGIAACHATARSYEETDWWQIIDLYDHLYRVNPSPVVALNRAVARSRLLGPGVGIEEIEPIRNAQGLARYHLLPAVLAELWAEAGNPAEAARLYRQALGQPSSEPERRFLVKRLGLVTAS